jgi:Signal transduction histidine kinase
MTDTERDEMDAAAITNNIAHELRTPVTSMRGYLETLLEHKDLPEEKQKDFLEKAYKQCIRLSEIMQDVILLSKTNYAPQFFLYVKNRKEGGLEFIFTLRKN